MDQEQPMEAPLTALIDNIKAAFALAAGHIAAADPQTGYEEAVAVLEVIRSLKYDATQVRAAQVRRIWEAEPMSLAELGERTGLSKSMVAQMVPPRARPASPGRRAR